MKDLRPAEATWVAWVQRARWPEATSGKLSTNYAALLLFTAGGDHTPWSAMGVLGVLALLGLFGFLVNEWCDRDDDARAGKSNAFSSTPRMVALGLLVALAAGAGAAAWHALSVPSTVLVAIQLLIAVAYSAPPLRLKGRGVAGLIAVLYAQYVLPMTIVCAASSSAAALDWVVLVGWASACGLCLEVGHQRWDRVNDARAAICTFASTLAAPGLDHLHRRLVTSLAFANLGLGPYFAWRSGDLAGASWPAAVGALFLIYVALGLALAFRAHRARQGWVAYDPFYASRGDVADRLFTTWPNVTIPLVLSGIAATTTAGNWTLVAMTIAWIRMAMPHLDWRWHVREIGYQLRPPELLG